MIAATFFMTVAFGCQIITLANGDYRRVLCIALLGMVAADVCCWVVFSRRGRMRWAALAFAAPSLFIVCDFVRRAPFVWGFA
jgi:hypothetical protein